jgi:tetratricopeptide (TPR) repeat protein
MHRSARRSLATALVAVGSAVALVLAGAVLGSPGGAVEQEQTSPAATAPSGTPVEALQARLARVPGDYSGWARLGMLYVEQARTSADATWYVKAREAFDRSLQVRPQDNANALTGLAALHAAQHEFARAEQLARQALAVDDFDATAYGVLHDALTELGRYDEAAGALQQMADIDPGYAALTRVSYARELRGDVAGARAAMQQALDVSGSASEAGFALLHLGELAWAYGGDVAAAEGFWSRGLARDPTSLPLQAALARAAAAQGRPEQALQAYDEVTRRVPLQQPLVEHAELLAAQGRHDDAAAQLELVHASNALLEAGGSVVDLETALFEADHGDPGRAVAAARAAYDARPGNVFAADALAWALHAAGQDEQALPYADQALSLGVRPASFLFHRGMIAASVGNTGQARGDLQEALQVNPHFSVADAATARATLAGLAG